MSKIEIFDLKNPSSTPSELGLGSSRNTERN
jgi:hypothetical protein